MTSLTRTDTAKYLLARDHFVIVTHRRPDGDTLGSAALLCRGLQQLGKTAHVLQNPEVTPKYDHLLMGLTKPCTGEDDTVISVDVAAPDMLPSSMAALADRIDLRIDHHRTSATFSPEELVDPAAAACGQIIYDVLTEMGVALDEPMAIALYTAIATDTGCFRFANTQSHTLEVAARCAEQITDLYGLNQQLFGTVSLARLRLQGWLIDNALFLQDGKAVICPLPLDVEKRLGITEDDTENLSGFPRSIAGVLLAATLRQTEQGDIKMSVRAAPGYDAGAICARFGGGGHRGAAGATVHMTMEEAVNALTDIFLEAERQTI